MKSGKSCLLLFDFLLLVVVPTRSQLPGLDHLPGPPYLDAGANLQGRGRNPYVSGGGEVFHPRAPPFPHLSPVGNSLRDAEYDETPPYYTGGLSTESPLARPVTSLTQEITNLLNTLTRFLDRRPSSSAGSRPIYPAATKTALREPQFEDQIPVLNKDAGEHVWSGDSPKEVAPTSQSGRGSRVFEVMGNAIDSVATAISNVRKEVTKLLTRFNSPS